MHSWGTWDDKYFEQVADAADEIGAFIARWGRIGVMQTKEKFGTARVYCHFGFDCLHSIIWPRHHWIHRWWPYRLDLILSRYTMPVLNKIILPYQKFIYRMAYSQAVKKYSHLANEILTMADYSIILNGIAGYKYSDYWKEIK